MSGKELAPAGSFAFGDQGLHRTILARRARIVVPHRRAPG